MSNPHCTYERPRQQQRDIAYHDAARFFVALVYAILFGCALIPLIRPSEGWFYTPKVTLSVPSQDELAHKVTRAIVPEVK
jgi:hypothetical protein